MSKLIYEYSYGNQDILNCIVKIYRDKDYCTDIYNVIIDFDVFDKDLIPKVITEHEIISYYIEELPDEENIIFHAQHNIKIKARFNQRPETLISFKNKE